MVRGTTENGTRGTELRYVVLNTVLVVLNTVRGIELLNTVRGIDLLNTVRGTEYGTW